MSGTPLFLVAEFDGEGTTVGEMTRLAPGATVDIIVEPPVEVEGRRLLPTVQLLRGLPQAMVDGVLSRLREIGHGLEVLSQDRVAQRTLLRVHVPPEVPGSLGIQTMSHFLGPIRNPWVHVDDGTFYIRGRIGDPGHAEELARSLRHELAAAGVEAQVDVQAIDRHDLSVWEELIEATLGLSR